MQTVTFAWALAFSVIALLAMFGAAALIDRIVSANRAAKLDWARGVIEEYVKWEALRKHHAELVDDDDLEKVESVIDTTIGWVEELAETVKKQQIVIEALEHTVERQSKEINGGSPIKSLSKM